MHITHTLKLEQLNNLQGSFILFLFTAVFTLLSNLKTSTMEHACLTSYSLQYYRFLETWRETQEQGPTGFFIPQEVKSFSFLKSINHLG